MRFDLQHPQSDQNDRFVLSKGHAAPILYAAWAEAGLFPRSELLKLREYTSDLEGHPTPRLNFVDLATGSLGQGLAAAVGIALNARRIASPARTYVVMGDGESAEGSVWEAAQMGEFFKLDTICAVTDVNRLGQSRATQLGHDLEQLAARWRAFGWHAIILDGHDVDALLAAYQEARATKGKPTMILARTLKGKGVSFAENKDGWHGKAFKKGEELDKALAELESQYIKDAGPRAPIPMPEKKGSNPDLNPKAPGEMPAPGYKLGELVATREAYGTALAKLGALDPRVVALDSDVGNSTFSDRFEKQFPDRFYQAFIAEQGMMGAAMGLASRGAIAFPSTFACFLSRAYDFARMANISMLNVKMAGSHAGVSIGEDGPSQMALEDLAMMRAVHGSTVLYPCDANQTARLVGLMAEQHGISYLRTTREKTPILYTDGLEEFRVGGSRIVRGGQADDAVAVIAAGITVHEAIKAADELKQTIPVRVIDAYSVKPIDTAALVDAVKATGGRLCVVEDHWAEGGLGDAVLAALAEAGVAHQITRFAHLAVREMPASGKPAELLDAAGISARHIAAAVRGLR